MIIIISLISIGAVSAQDSNSTQTELEISDDADIIKEKPTPTVKINDSNVVTGDSINISLADPNDSTGLAFKNLTATVNKQEYVLTTGGDGSVGLKIDLPANKYVLNVKFIGDNDYAPITKTFDVTVMKANATIVPDTCSVVKNDYFYAYLTDMNGEPISGEMLHFSVNGKNYDYYTESSGKAGFQVSEAVGRYSLTISFEGNEYYNAVSKTIELIVPISTSIVIGNNILLTNGYLRIYLKSDILSAVSKKTIIVKIDGKEYAKTTTSEGFVVFKPSVGVGNHLIEARFDGDENITGSTASKTVSGIAGNVLNPLKSKIPLRNGVPDVDYMPKSYVMADEDMTYTLTKSQYKKVIKRDSYTLYLKNKMSKYVVFKSKSEPKYNHIIKREKWNVIEREINKKIVLKNKHNYWPDSVTVNLKGKSYNYPEVRDVQNTGYTCGPTSSSMCTQVLRNYYNEAYLAKMSGTSSSDGSSTKGLKKGLEKFNFKCTVYYKSSFNKALKQLKKGGCALVFHTWGHYVAILDISADGKKVLVGNPSGDYDTGSHSIPTNWLTVKYMKKRFNNYDTSGLIVKLSYSLGKSAKNKLNNLYSSMGTNWNRHNTSERIPNTG
ncbi:cysteine peptidase family C39 domain-containing protein [Methanobrevibacter sp.]|uniref:cysteine peptidase family C39 domain-containing protein n=1 Tax=Methanobrevibacter sp. TaxID=66852 RepID=UPI003869AE59